MGDLLQTVPLIAGLREVYPDTPIRILCVDEFRPILEGIGLDNIAVGVPAELAVRLRADDRPDNDVVQKVLDYVGELPPIRLIINCNHEAPVAQLCSRIPAEKRLGRVYRPDTPLIVEGEWGRYFFSFSKDRKANPYNIADIYRGMAGIPFVPFNSGIVRLPYRKITREYLCRNGYVPDRPLIAVQLGTNSGFREWGVEQFGKMALRLYERLKCRFLVIGSSGDQERAQEFVSMVGPDKVIDASGKTNLIHLPSLLSHCDLLITNDTGPMHVANYVGIRVLSIHCASAYFAETAPYGSQHVVVHSARDCYPCFPITPCHDCECKEDIMPETIAGTAYQMYTGALPNQVDTPGVNIYATSFRQDGILTYRSLSSRPSSQYETGKTNAMLWDKVLGLKHRHKKPGDPENPIGRERLRRDMEMLLPRLHNGKSAVDGLIAVISSKTEHMSRKTSDFLGTIREMNAILAQRQDTMLAFHLALEFAAADDGNLASSLRNMRELLAIRLPQMLEVFSVLVEKTNAAAPE